MASWGAQGREERLNAYYDPADIIDTRTFNMVLGGVVLEGLLVNYILCLTVGNIYEYINPIAFLVAYFVFCFLGIFISRKSTSPIVSFIGYNMVVVPSGLCVSTLVYFYGGVDSYLVRDAFLYTAIITAVMVGGALAFPDFFESIGRMLLASLFGAFIAGIICVIVGFETTIISFAIAVIFAFYIGYDFYRSQQFEKTYDNAVDCAIDIYLDIINLFIRILQILGRRGRRR